MGEDVADMATTTSQLQAKLLTLTGGRVDIMLDENTFKNSTQILREMADAWEYMTDIQRASALELMGGKRQANTLSALIQNFDTVEEVIEASSNSAGSALRENEVFLDSFEGRMQQLTATTQSKWQEALDTDLIKDAIQLLTKLIETINFEDSALLDIVHGLIKGLSWLADIFENSNIVYTIVALFGARSLQTNGLLDMFTDLKKTSKETIESLTDDIKSLDTEITSLTERADKQSGIMQKNTLQKIDVKKQLRENKQRQLEEMKLTPKEQQEVVETFDVGAMQKKLGGKKGLVTIRTNQLTKNGATPEQIQSDPKIKQWNKEIEEGQKALDDYNNKVKETDESLTQVNVTTTKASGVTNTNASAQKSNTNSNAENQGARQANAATTDAQTGEIIEQNGALDQNTSKLKNNTGALSGVTGKLKAFGKQMVQTMAYTALIQGAMQLLDGIMWALGEAWNAIFPPEKTFEDLHEEFEKTSSDLAEEKAELKSLEGKLEDVESKIRDIQALGSLSFTSQEELNNLQKQSAELERQIEMKKILAKNAQYKTNNASLTAADAYLRQSAETEDALEEAKEEAKQTGENIGGIVDAVLMIGGAVTMIASSWTGIGAIVGGVLVAAGGAGVGRGAGGAIGGAVGEAEYKKQQTNREAIDSYQEKKEDYERRLAGAYAQGDAKTYAELDEEYKNFEAMMADNIGGLMQYLSEVDYDTLSEERKRLYEDYNKMVNQYMLANGASITDAIDSILDYDKYEKTGYEFDQIQTKFKKGDISADEASQEMWALINASPSLRAEFEDLDIDIQEVIDSYIKLGEAAKQDVPLMSSLDKISAVTGAFDDLGNAIKEFREEGNISVGTLESLNEKFGKLDEFEELYKVLATGEGDLEAAVTNVANAYVGQVGTLTDITDEELEIMTSRLKALGVLNAEEVLMARQKGQAQLDALGLAYSIDLSNYGTAEQAKIAIAQAAGLNIADIQDNEVQSLAKKYGVDLENYASVEEKKIAIAQARAKAEAQADRDKLKKDYDNHEIDYAEYQAGLTAINNSLNFDSMSETIRNIINSAYQGFKFNFDGQIGIGSDYDEDLIDGEAANAFQESMDYWENRIAANQAKYGQIQNEIDLLEAKGMRAGEDYYREQIALENQRKSLLEQQRAEAAEYLKTLKPGSEHWWEVANTINDIEGELDDVIANVQELNDAIGEIRWYGFEQLHDRFSNLTSDLENIRDILSDEDMFDDEGNFTEEGVANLATYIQELEIYKNALTDVQNELKDFKRGYEGNEDYFATIGIDSEQEYYDKLIELTDKQDEYTKVIKDSEQSVVEMYENQIDAIEEYMGELIDGYNDYIDAVKESLDAERDLYTFKKNVQKQNKDIASLERRIASLSGSTNASDIAERRRLESELYSAREELDDTYYEHSRDTQADALDKEAQAYEESMNRYVEGLRTTLEEAAENMTLFLESVANVVIQNAGSVEDVYENTGLALDSAIVDPWTKAAEAMDSYEDDSLSRMNDWTKAGANGYFYNFNADATNQLESPWSAGATAANTFAENVSSAMGKVYDSVQSNVDNSLTKLKELDDGIQDSDNKPDGTVDTDNPTTPNGNSMPKADVKKLQYVLNQVFGANLKEDGSYGPATIAAVKKAQKTIGVNQDGYYGSNTRAKMVDYIRYKWQANNGSSSAIGQGIQTMLNKLPTSYYAKGTFGTKQDQFAITDEFGPELTMYATPEGTLSFMRAGSTVVPAEITKNLVEWGQFSPDAINVGGGVNVNMINNAINKPEFNFAFDALVKAERIDENTLPEVKRFVQQEINSLVRQMNYAIKGKGGR